MPRRFAALSGKPVAQHVFQGDRYPSGAHIELAVDVDLMVVAPATANLMAKFAMGIADDLISTLYLQVEAPVMIAPAMSASMWNKPSVQRNVDAAARRRMFLCRPRNGLAQLPSQRRGPDE